MNRHNPIAGPSSSPSSAAATPLTQHDNGVSGSGGNGAGPSGSGSGTGGAVGLGTAALGPLVEPHQDLNEFLESFWTRQMDYVEGENPDFRTYPLPLARIKKVMKSDEEVKMISAEAPIMFSRACEIFIAELTCRAWLIAEANKRRTLQKSDVAAAIALSDMFDFLIDILPRDDDEAGAHEGEEQQEEQEHEQDQQGYEGDENGHGTGNGSGNGNMGGAGTYEGVEGVERAQPTGQSAHGLGPDEADIARTNGESRRHNGSEPGQYNGQY